MPVMGAMPCHAMQVMGVSPNADTAAIRAAYKRLMMDLHPDKAAVKGTADLCALVNEIYTVRGSELGREQGNDLVRWQMYGVGGGRGLAPTCHA
eukprot:248524-Chlamydomonas_euryale.AAC.2